MEQRKRPFTDGRISSPEISRHLVWRRASRGEGPKDTMLARHVCSAFDFSGRWLRPIVVVLLVGAGALRAQTIVYPTHDDGVVMNGAPLSANDVSAALPDAPLPQAQEQKPNNKPLMTESTKTATASMPVAPMYSGVIPAGEATPQIHKWDKMTLAGRNLYSATSVASFFVSAGWSHLTNGQPNYGTNSEAFGKRLGAAAIRDSSQAFLSNGPFAVWFHQDPRYFALGPRHSFARRTWYAITRPLITRDSSDGHAVFNTSLILGQAAGTALNNLYYPKSNRNFHDNVASFGGSMGGAALSFVLDEYTSQLLNAVRLRHPDRSK